MYITVYYGIPWPIEQDSSVDRVVYIMGACRWASICMSICLSISFSISISMSINITRHSENNTYWMLRCIRKYMSKNVRMEVHNTSGRCHALRHCPVAASSEEQSVPARSNTCPNSLARTCFILPTINISISISMSISIIISISMSISITINILIRISIPH